ncbi:MAG TPA: amidohydrolase family protein [Chthonomonadaceae bacterium]|nr:amidohydrolase family protein [Chthonomonadaceae bacterium]
MRKSSCFALLSALFICLSLRLLAQQANDPVPIRYRLSDCHFHFVDFLQKTDGIKAVLEAMNRAGVDHTMLCGMPLVKEWSVNEPVQPGYYLDDDARCYWYSATDVFVAREVQTLSPEDRARVHPFICGFNGADRNAVDHVQRMLDWYPGFWEGIGEVMARHDDLSALTYGYTSQANSVALDPVYKLAAAHDLPVFIHSNISSVWKRTPLYLNEMEQAVKKNPKTRFVWCHAGVSRRIDVPTLTTEIRRMLKTYHNLSIDLSWVVFDTYLYKDNKVADDWVSVIKAFPDRFMIGSDIVGHFATYAPTVQRYYALLDALKPETAQKVARDNFLAILPKKAAK